MMEGWVFDVQEEIKGVGLWLVDERGRTRKLCHPFKPYFYLTGSKSSIEAAVRILQAWKVPLALQREAKKEFYSAKTVPCMKVSVDAPRAYPKIVKALSGERRKGFDLYTCDLSVAQIFFIETGLFPMARVILETEAPESPALRDSPWETDYA